MPPSTKVRHPPYGMIKPHRTRPPSASLMRFASPYCILNALLLATYAWVRYRYLHSTNHKYSWAETPEQLALWERRVASMLGAAGTIRLYKRRSADSFLADLFTSAKCSVALLTLLCDSRIFVLTVLAYFLLFVLLPQPTYTGPSKVHPLTSAAFSQRVLQEKQTEAWVVLFHTTWSSACAQFEPTFAALSLQYTSPRLQFAKVDIGMWPNLGKTNGISQSAASTQLPTIALFKEGKEVARIPQVLPGGMIGKFNLRRADVVKALGLSDQQFAT